MYKSYINYCAGLIFTAILMIATMQVVKSQMVGVNQVAHRTVNNFDSTLQSFGCVDFWDSRYGVELNTGGTNSMKWYGIQGSKYYWSNFTTNPPQYVSTITTNNFSSINFAAGVSNVLREDRLATELFNAGQPITVAILECSQANGLAIDPFVMGNTLSSNANASFFKTITHAGTPTTFGLGFSYNTNQSIINATAAGGETTNKYNIYIVSWSNATIAAMSNLRGSQATIGSGTVTFNTCAIGNGFRTNNTPTASWFGSMGYIGVFTNATYGSGLTNLFWYLNTNYSNGAYKILNSP